MFRARRMARPRNCRGSSGSGQAPPLGVRIIERPERMRERSEGGGETDDRDESLVPKAWSRYIERGVGSSARHMVMTHSADGMNRLCVTASPAFARHKGQRVPVVFG